MGRKRKFNEKFEDGVGYNTYIPKFDGEDFEKWSKMMERLLDEQGILYIVKHGYEMPTLQSLFTVRQKLEIKQYSKGNNRANAWIFMYLSADLSLKFSHIESAKEVWDKLNKMRAPSRMLKLARSLRDERPMIPKHRIQDFEKKISVKEKPRTKGDRSGHASCNRQLKSRVNATVSGTRSFDLVLSRTAVKPAHQLHFPVRACGMLPSTNITSKVSCGGKVHEIKFSAKSYKKGMQKYFGFGWKKFVTDHKLKIGDILKFKIAKIRNSKLLLWVTLAGEENVQLRPKKQIINKRRVENVDDSDDNDDGKFDI